VLRPGAGTELDRGVGAIVLFGILGAAVVSLTMLPSLTVTVLEWQARRGGRKGATPVTGVAATPGAHGSDL
jgi:predicted RND superfamily exporter protein